ncbi:MAG: hypothetical protein ABR514_00095 [Chthoniobacterales bacterium]
MALLRHRISVLVVAGVLVLLCLFAFFSVPFVVSNALRFWLSWKARQEHLSCQIDKIEAPFLRPVIVRGLRLQSEREAAFQIDARVAQIELALNLGAIVLPGGGRAISHVAIDGLRMEISRGHSAETSLSQAAWATLQRLLPGSFDFERINLRIETGRAVILLRNVSVSGNEIEAGRFASDQIMLISPWFRQSFSQLRGATKWEGNKLTVAGLSLASGLDLPSITTDLSQMDRQTVGLDFDVEVSGGKIRADVAHTWRPGGVEWNVVASASDISLAQTAEALGFAERLGGLLHACNVTFRGNLLDPTGATGWLWTEVSAPAWRDRAADVVMLGATLTNREIHIQQFYVQQGSNELTLSGEASWPGSWAHWLGANFAGDVSASIVDLRDFAGLLGANREHFAGALTVEGTVTARARSISGHFTANGSGLTLFEQPVDLLKADLNLKATELEIEAFELTHDQDFLRVTGKIDISHGQDSHGTIAVSLRDLANYIRTAPIASALTAQLSFDGGNGFIESLELRDGPLAIGFGGTVDFASLQNFGITLIPTDVLFDLGWTSDSECASAVEFLPAPGPEKFRPQIEKIDLHGDVLTGAWRVALRKRAGPDQEWPLCARGHGQALKIGVADRATAEFSQSSLRTFRSGEGRTLTLLPDRP